MSSGEYKFASTMQRINIPGAAYLITTNSDCRFPFFNNKFLCNLLEHTIEEVLHRNDSLLIGYKINPEHVHLIFQIGIDKDLSQVIQSLKRISSCRINQILHYHYENNPYHNLELTRHMINLCDKFYKNSLSHEFPKFKWQKGFYDKLIRTPEQMHLSLEYLKKQNIKHGLDSDLGLKIYTPVPANIFYIGN